MMFLPKSIAPLCRIAATESSRYSMTAVKLINEPHGGFRAEATDGRKLAIVQEGPTYREGDTPSVTSSLYKKIMLLHNEQGPERSFGLVPSDVLAEAFRLQAKDKSHDRIGVFLGPEEAVIIAGPNHTVTRVPYVEGRYPDVSHVIPRTQPNQSVRVNPEVLGGVLALANEMLKRAGSTENAVNVLFYGDEHEQNKPFGVSLNVDSLYLDAIAMPISQPKAK